jgi:hypothetical protein
VPKAPCLGDAMRRIRMSSMTWQPRVCFSRVFSLSSSGFVFFPLFFADEERGKVGYS